MPISSVIRHACDLTHPLTMTSLRHALVTGDEQGDRFEIAVTRGREPVDMTGAEVMAYFLRASDSATVAIPGVAEGNAVTVTLPSTCYAEPGRFTLTVKASLNGTRHALYVCEGAVLRSRTDAILDPAHIIPDLQDLLAMIERLEQTTAAATTATTAANTAASKATDAAATATKAAADAKQQVFETVTDAKQQVAETITDAKQQVSETITDAKQQVSETITDAKQQVSETITNAKQQVSEAVANANTAASNADKATEAATQATAQATNAAQSATTAAAQATEAATAAGNAAEAATQAMAQATAATAKANTAAFAANTAASEATAATEAAATAASNADQAAEAATQATAQANNAAQSATTAAAQATAASSEANRAAEAATTATSNAAAATVQATDAAANANAAATQAANAASTARESAAQAATAASNADQAAEAAQSAAETAAKWGSVTATVTMLAAEQTATVTLTDTETGKSLAFRLPRGLTGLTPNLKIGTVTTGAAGSEATATITGTAENPLLNLTLPRGDVGEIRNLIICGKTQDASGRIVLTAEDVGALPVGAPLMAYGTCDTAASTAAKAVTLTDGEWWRLVPGSMAAVKFQSAVPSGATLNVNADGAKPILYRGEALPANVIPAGSTATFIYDGARYHLLTVDSGAADKLATARKIMLTGDVTGEASFDGSENASIAVTLADSGVDPMNGMYGPHGDGLIVSLGSGTGVNIPAFRVDAKGRITEIQNRKVYIERPTNITGSAGTAAMLATARRIALSGDVDGGASFDGSTDVTLTATLPASGVIADSYGPTEDASPGIGGSFTVPQFAVDGKGRVTSASARKIKLPAAAVMKTLYGSSIAISAGTKITLTEAPKTGSLLAVRARYRGVFTTVNSANEIVMSFVEPTSGGADLFTITLSYSGTSATVTEIIRTIIRSDQPTTSNTTSSINQFGPIYQIS